MTDTIRVRNLYFMLLYAWDLFSESQLTDVATVEGPNEANFFANLLQHGVKRLLRRGLDRGYQEVVEQLRGPRGRFLLSDSVKQNSFSRRQAVCAFDELTPDIARNRILKLTMRVLVHTEGIQPSTADELRSLIRGFSDVSDVPYSRDLLRQAQLSRNSRHYAVLLNLCDFVLHRMLPGEGDARGHFSSILEDEITMSTLFEAFVRNFLRLEQTEYQIQAAQIPWSITASDADLLYIPRMRTDITLLSKRKVVIIDTKFYRSPLRSYRGSNPKLRSEHLYQIQSYMQHGRRSFAPETEGILLYAAAGGLRLELDYICEGLPLRVRTLDLDQPWATISANLVGLIATRCTPT